jgi:Amt family ammonium transporter
MDFCNKIDSGATAWVLASAALVLLMTPALAFFYGGMVRAKHVLSMIMQNFMVMALVGITWVLVSYSIAFGPGKVGGGFRFAGLSHICQRVPGYIDGKEMVIPPLAFAIFQMMFAVITAALITGSAADRWRFAAFVPFIVLWSILVYAPTAHWVFSPVGWAETLKIGSHTGALDFAGGTVVHASAGAAGLAIAIVLGPRDGWRGPEEREMRPHNMPFVLLGTALLWFGWFGFNAGSALRPDMVAAYAFVNTNTAAAAGMLSWILAQRLMSGKATTLGAASGVVAGLVAITPCAGYVKPLSAIVIGVLAGLGCGVAVTLMNKSKWDDSLDVFGIHLVGGVIGSLAVGLFATRAANPNGADGLFIDGRLDQLALQIITVAAVVTYSFTVTLVIGALLGLVLGDRGRASRQDERKGLDFSLFGESAYWKLSERSEDRQAGRVHSSN